MHNSANSVKQREKLNIRWDNRDINETRFMRNSTKERGIFILL
jgi:hypothetical protein